MRYTLIAYAQELVIKCLPAMKSLVPFHSGLVHSGLAAAMLCLLLLGCDSPPPSFPDNDVHALTLSRSRDVPTDRAKAAVSDVIKELFGTPDEPRWPNQWIDADLRIKEENLSRASGPQLSEKDGTHRGLFREHCVICHAISGSGTGPASLLQNPYPRDFRSGVYKWKSTTRDAKPTRDDLLKLLHQGVAGTGMPSFSLIDTKDLNALVDYVIYLSVRGEVERELMATAVDDLGYGEDSVDEDAKLNLPAAGEGAESEDAKSEGTGAIEQVMGDVSAAWARADANVVAVPDEKVLDRSDLAASIDRGDDLFHGPIANCVGCHGKGGSGDVVTLDYDDWAKEYSTRLGLTPTNREAMRPFKKAGAPTPRLAKPRNLTDGVYRGGKDTEILYRRITQGIAGSPMPGVAVVNEAGGAGLTVEQIFDLIRYVQSLSEEAAR